MLLVIWRTHSLSLPALFLAPKSLDVGPSSITWQMDRMMALWTRLCIIFYWISTVLLLNYLSTRANLHLWNTQVLTIVFTRPLGKLYKCFVFLSSLTPLTVEFKRFKQYNFKIIYNNFAINNISEIFYDQN